MIVSKGLTVSFSCHVCYNLVTCDITVTGVELLRNGFGLRLKQQDSPMLEMIFDSRLELKKFCLAVFGLTKNKSMREYCLLAGWEEEVGMYEQIGPPEEEGEDEVGDINMTRASMRLHNLAHPSAAHKDPRSDFNRISFLAMSAKPSRPLDSVEPSNARSRSNSNSPTPSSTASVGSRSASSPALRREESFSLSRGRVLGDPPSPPRNTADSTTTPPGDKCRVDFSKADTCGTVLFSAPCLLLWGRGGSGGTGRPGAFSGHVLQVHGSGLFVFTDTREQIASSNMPKPTALKCSKFLCSKFDPSCVHRSVLRASRFQPSADKEMEEVIVTMQIHEESPRGEGESVTAHV